VPRLLKTTPPPRKRSPPCSGGSCPGVGVHDRAAALEGRKARPRPRPSPPSGASTTQSSNPRAYRHIPRGGWRPADHASLHFDPPLSMAQPDNGPAHGAFQEARWPAARRSAGGEARPHGEAAPRPRCADTNTSTTQRVKSARGSSVPRGAVLRELGTGLFPSRPGTVLAIAN
jgi:hypothetical protein